MHIGLDAGIGQIVAATLTAKEVDDGAEVGPLLVHALNRMSELGRPNYARTA